MPVRAFIIAIEDYPAATDLPATLPGTTKAGNDFRAWLLRSKGVDSANIRYCVAPGHEGRTAGTTRLEIVDELEHRTG